MNRYQTRVRERFYRILSEQNLKHTKPRQALIDLLLKKRGWQFQADELLRELNEIKPGVVSRATVYRTLDLLVAAAVLRKIQIHGNSFCYELSPSGVKQHYLVDLQTGQSVEFGTDKGLQRMLARIAKQHNFVEQFHVLEIFGEFNKKPRRNGRQKAKP